MFLFFLNSIADCENGIFQKVFNDKIILIDVGGSSKQDINGSMQMTKPEYAIYPWNKRYDWCSNCGRNYDEHPYIRFSLKNKKFKFNSYFVRCGCCYHHKCCCEDENIGCFYCCLYSWSLRISDDNKTWTEVHRMKDEEMRRCNEKTYKLDKTYSAKYVEVIQNEACPGDPPCIALNRFELYGDVIDDNGVSDDFVSYHDDDDDVSIIGHISKNGNVKLV
ncbi:hypothetical protein TVAG_421120 [Trichomonas vaginalis G3]|uniref:F5/8 type C domain-containing protein n=1 Tax=Trichomonas vaginalis (strain ATCC PRA-98 / G3) TaxID=412133 RepID=A2EVT7_TRIV3|nr:hypothetical protein TVAGG3_0204260 [Trichomonas vaginalis G3]EAY03224.1 hypothetical protein TVAG_421120 [Trichomonas vaginalis G3]KAI5550822.1 hypothetical protein TVAGG3_0204260 [Trichomonas vaginalis G3]|eukprot:XP_001315447.1 hypothetical protein [Trichomonas vaginalis G3]